jgi:murein DD-endopeptidase MepM/ murein hydrolase activator NlpD
MKYWKILATLATVLLLGGCAATDERLGDKEWYQKTREISGKAVNLAKSTAVSSYERMQKYLKEKDALKRFHDAGEESETAVLDVLHRAGIGKRSATASTGGAPPPASSSTPPGKARTPATPGAKTPAMPSVVAKVPAHYSGAYRWPLEAGIISSDYGARWGKMHKGIDIAAHSGEPVYAVAAGEVIYAGDGLRGYGNVIILKHDDKVTSLYAHNSALKVKQGDPVKQGDLIALLGSTGHSTGPHVHFEFRQNDLAVNPHSLLPKSTDPETVAMAPAELRPLGVAAAGTVSPSR